MLAALEKLDELKTLLNSRTTVKITKEASYLNTIQMFEFKISFTEIKEFKERIIELLTYDYITLRLNTELSSQLEFEKELEKFENSGYSDEQIRGFINFTQKKKLPLIDKDIFYCSSFCAESLLGNLISKLSLEEITNLTEKIRIYVNDTTAPNSSLFQFITDINSSPESLYNFSFESYTFNNSLEIYPHAFPFENKKKLKKYSIEMLKLISDKVHNNNTIVFSNKNIQTVEIDTINALFSENYSSLSDIIKFLIEEEGRTQTKRVLINNHIEDFLSQGKTINDINRELWSKILDQVRLDYKLFINEEVNKFNDDKRKIIKEQFDISYQISEKANQIKHSFINNIIYISGVFLSQFFINALNEDNEIFNFIAILISLLIVSAVLFINFVNERFSSYKNFENKILMINKYYPTLYISEDNIVNDLEEKISNPEINKLKTIELVCMIVYIILFLVLLSILLYLSFQNNYFSPLISYLRSLFFNN